MGIQETVETVGQCVDAAGVAAIVVGAVVAGVNALRRARDASVPVYGAFRQQLGRSILLGLELLVAADIIRTVAVAPTFESVGVLAGIVLIRFLEAPRAGDLGAVALAASRRPAPSRTRAPDQHGRRPVWGSAGGTIRRGAATFYPEGLPSAASWSYAAGVDSIEINGSFYSLQRPAS